MRSITFGLIFGTLLVFAAHGFARGDDEEGETPSMDALQAEVDALQLEVRYLRSREEALTRYVLGNELRADGLERVVKAARAKGFEANRIPVDSRKTLLAGMESMAGSLRTDLPKVTKKELVLLKKAKAAR